MERPIRRGVRLLRHGKAGRRFDDRRNGAITHRTGLPSICFRYHRYCRRQGSARHDLRGSAKCPECSVGPVMASTDMRVLECRDRCHLVPGPAHAKRLARHGISPVVARCACSQAWSSPLHSMCWTGMRGIHTHPTRILTTSPAGPSLQPMDTHNRPCCGGEVSCGLPTDLPSPKRCPLPAQFL